MCAALRSSGLPIYSGAPGAIDTDLSPSTCNEIPSVSVLFSLIDAGLAFGAHPLLDGAAFTLTAGSRSSG